MERPELDTKISVQDFKSYYWLKEELAKFCREVGIYCSGGKIEIAQAIINYLESGKVNRKPTTYKKGPVSTFDWTAAHLALDTVITDNYSNTENVRNFFKTAIGELFKFNVEFMNWMKVNKGKTLAEAVEKWKEIAVNKKVKDKEKIISPQFEYNTYIRDFLLDNPGLSTKEAIKYWKIRKAKPGPAKYSKEDIT